MHNSHFSEAANYSLVDRPLEEEYGGGGIEGGHEANE